MPRGGSPSRSEQESEDPGGRSGQHHLERQTSTRAREPNRRPSPTRRTQARAQAASRAVRAKRTLDAACAQGLSVGQRWAKDQPVAKDLKASHRRLKEEGCRSTWASGANGCERRERNAARRRSIAPSTRLEQHEPEPGHNLEQDLDEEPRFPRGPQAGWMT